MSDPVAATNLESFFRRYWFVLRERCRQLLGAGVDAEQIPLRCLADRIRTAGARAEPGEHLEALWHAVTQACLEQLAGPRGRDAAWIQSLQRRRQAAEGAPSEATAAADPQETVLGLLDRIGSAWRPAIIYRTIDRLDITTIARLTGRRPARIRTRLTRFHEQANALLAARAEPGLPDPEPSECPDRLALARLLAGESRGLASARAHLEQHPDCAQALEDLRTRQREALTDEGVTQGLEALDALLARGLASAPGGWGRPRVWLSAVGLAAVVGVILMLALPAPPSGQSDPILAQEGFAMQVVFQGDQGLRPVQPEEHLPAGARVQFRFGAARPMLVAVAALVDQGPSLRINPEDNPVWPVPIGTLALAPFSHRLAPGAGPERIFALFCPIPAPMNYFSQMIEFAYQPGANGHRDLRRDFVGAPKHCHLRSLLIERTDEPIDFSPGNGLTGPDHR